MELVRKLLPRLPRGRLGLISSALTGFMIIFVVGWYYHVPVAGDLPIEDSWKTLRKDWYGVAFMHARYYRFEAPGVPEKVSSRVRERLKEVGPWDSSKDENEAEVTTVLRAKWEGRPVGDNEIVKMVRYSLRCSFDQGRGIEYPTGCFVSRRMRHFKDRSAYRVIYVRVSEGPSGTSIVEIWDVDRFDT